MLNICALGELLIDFSQVKIEGEFPIYRALPGGAPCNFLAACAANGCKCSFLGKVGNDDFGKMLRNTLSDVNIDISGLLLDKNYFTTLAFVSLDEYGERSFSFSRKPGADTMFTENEINFSLIDNCDIFHFGTLSMTDEPSNSATIKALQYAQQKNKIITFDPNYRAPLWLDINDAINSAKTGFNYADIVKISLEEAEFYFGKNFEQSTDILINEYGVKLVAVTMGSKGCYCKTSAFELYIEGVENNNTVDTTGAGDIWFGYFISNFVKNRVLNFDKDNVLYAAEIANAAASLSTSTYGGISSVPPYHNTLKFLNSK